MSEGRAPGATSWYYPGPIHGMQNWLLHPGFGLLPLMAVGPFLGMQAVCLRQKVGGRLMLYLLIVGLGSYCTSMIDSPSLHL